MNNSTYNGYAVYRFLDKGKRTIYIGRSKNIYKRIYKQHFTNKGHLDQSCYDNTCLIEIIKLDNNIECKMLEEYLIEHYRPEYNKQDKSKSYSTKNYGRLEPLLSNMENWTTYRFIRDFDNDFIYKNKKDGILAYIFCILFFIGIIYEFIF